MKYCKRCEKDTPTSSKGGVEECMVCGAPLVEPKPAPEIKFVKSAPEIKPKPKEISKVTKTVETPRYIPNVYDNGSNTTYSSGGGASAILGGIMVMIIGFSVLTVGNYVIMAISESLPSVASGANYTLNSEMFSVTSYVSTVLPLVGLAAMVMGFGVILFTLRGSMGNGDY